MRYVFSWRVLKPQVFPPLPVGDAPASPRSLKLAERGFFLERTFGFYIRQSGMIAAAKKTLAAGRSRPGVRERGRQARQGRPSS